MDLVARKPDFVASKQQMDKPACMDVQVCQHLSCLPFSENNN